MKIEAKAPERALLQKENFYRTLVDAFPHFVLLFNLEGAILAMNDAMAVLLGYNSIGEVLSHSKNVFDYIAPYDCQRAFHCMQQIRDDAVCHNLEIHIRHIDGQYIPLEINMLLFKNPNDKPVGFLCICRDARQGRKSKHRYSEAEMNAMQSNWMGALEIIVSGVAHEINNPNQFILSNAQLLKKIWENVLPILEDYHSEKGDFDIGGMKYSEFSRDFPLICSMIIDGSRRIKTIVNEFRDHSAESTNSLTGNVDINDVVKSAVSQLMGLIHDTTHRLDIVYDETMPTIMCNAKRLQEALVQLIKNACQSIADPRNGIYISTHHNQEQNCVWIIIRDEGNGIEKEYFDQIFVPFYTTKRSSGCVGLGLTICSTVMKELGGRIDFSSTPESGTTVKVSLPILERRRRFQTTPVWSVAE